MTAAKDGAVAGRVPTTPRSCPKSGVKCREKPGGKPMSGALAAGVGVVAAVGAFVGWEGAMLSGGCRRGRLSACSWVRSLWSHV